MRTKNTIKDGGSTAYKQLTVLLKMLTMVTLLLQLWSKKAILPIYNMAIMLNGLLSKKAGQMDGWIGLTP